MFTKCCTVCKEEKHVDLYYNFKASKDGKAYRCKSCDDIAVKKYKIKNRGKMLANQRKANRLYKYGLTDEDYLKMKEEQDMKCWICKVGLQENATNRHTSETLCIDHDHETGEVRGLLCTRCNKGLGMFDDSIEHLLESIKYLSK